MDVLRSNENIRSIKVAENQIDDPQTIEYTADLVCNIARAGEQFISDLITEGLVKRTVQLMENKDKIVCLEMKGLSRAECVLRMCACDVFVLPTKSEGSPQALKEAMACNCPIVATDVADIKYLLGNEQGHYLITNKSNDTSKWIGDDKSPSELASCLQLAIEYNHRTNGRSRIISLGLDNKHVAKKLNEIYMSVMMNKE